MNGMLVTGELMMLKAAKDLFSDGALLPKMGMFFILSAPR